jgi:hypothetical protein
VHFWIFWPDLHLRGRSVSRGTSMDKSGRIPRDNFYFNGFSSSGSAVEIGLPLTYVYLLPRDL